MERLRSQTVSMTPTLEALLQSLRVHEFIAGLPATAVP